MTVYSFWIVLGVAALLALGLVTAIATLIGSMIGVALATTWRWLTCR